MSFRAAYVSYADYGGPLVHTKEFVRSFQKLMPDLVTYTPYLDCDLNFHPRASGSFFNKVFAYLPEWLRRLKHEFYQLRKLRRDKAKWSQFYRLFKDNDIDILIFRIDAYVMGALKAAEKLGIPFLLEANGILIKHNRDRVTHFYEKYCWKNAAGIYPVCGPLADLMVSEGADPKKIRVITNGVRLETHKQPDLSVISNDLIGQLKGKKIIGYVGTFTDYHDVITLLESMKLSLVKAPELCLLLIGAGRNASRIQGLSKRSGLEDKVFFTGMIPHEYVPAYLNVCDILALPLRQLYEETFHGAPVKMFEYMAAKKPIISTNMRSIRKLAGESILYAAPGSIAQWEESIVRLLGNRQLCAEKGTAAYNQLVNCGYTWDDNAMKVYSFCEEILANINEKNELKAQNQKACF